MPSVTVISKLIGDVSMILVSLMEFSRTLSSESIKEDIEQYEKLRLDAISRHIRKTGRSSVYKNTKPRPTVFPRTGRVLLVQNGINDESKHKNSRPRINPRKHVCNEPGSIRPR